MLNKKSIRTTVSIMALTIALGVSDAAHAVTVPITDDTTASGLGVVNGDDLSYNDTDGSAGDPLDFTVDTDLTLGNGTVSLVGSEGDATSTTADVINIILDNGATPVSLTMEDDVIADGVNGGAAPDLINFNLSVDGADTLTLGVDNTDTFNLGAGTIQLRNAGDTVNLENDITLGSLTFNGTNADINVADGVTITGDVDNNIGQAGNLIFNNSGVLNGNVGASSTVNNLQIDNGGTVELQGTSYDLSEYNLNGGATLQITNAATLSGRILSDGDGTGTLDVDSAGVVVDSVIGFGGNDLASVTVDTAGSLEVGNDVNADDIVLEGAGTLILNGAGLVVSTANGISGTGGTVSVLSSAEIAGVINDISLLSVDGAANLTVSNPTVDADNITLDGAMRFIGPDPITVSGDVNSTGGSAGTLDLDQSVVFTDNVGSGQSIGAMEVRGGFTATLQGTANQIDSVLLADDGGSGGVLLFDQNGTTFSGNIDSDNGDTTGVIDINANVVIASGSSIGQTDIVEDVQIISNRTLDLRGDLRSTDLTLEGFAELNLNGSGIVVEVVNGIQDTDNNGTLSVNANAQLLGDIGTVGDGIAALDIVSGALDVGGSVVNAAAITLDGTLQLSGADTTVYGPVDSTGGSAGALIASENVTFANSVGSTAGASIATLNVSDGRAVTLESVTNNIDATVLEGVNGSTLNIVTNGTILNGDIDSDSSEQGIVNVDATAEIAGQIGATRRLEDIQIADAEELTLRQYARSNDITLEGDASLLLDGDNINIVTNSGIDGDTASNGTLTLAATSVNALINGDVGASNGIALLELQNDSSMTISGTTIDAQSITLGNATTALTFTGQNADITVNDIEGPGILNFNESASVSGTIGANAAVGTINVGSGYTLDIDSNVTASNIRLDNATFQTVDTTIIDADIDSAAAQTDGNLDVDADTTVLGDIGNNDRLATLDIDAAGILRTGGTNLNVANMNVLGETSYTDTVSLSNATNLTYQDGSVIRLSAMTLAGTNPETNNPVYIDADTNNATVSFFPNANVDIEFDVNFLGTVDIVDATGGTLALNGVSFDLTNVGALTTARVDAFVNDRITLTAASKPRAQVQEDLNINEAEAEAIIAADNFVTTGLDATGRTALDTAILGGNESARVAAVQLTPDVNTMGNSLVAADAGRANFSNISVRLATLRSGRSFINSGYDRTGLASGNGHFDDNFWVRGFAQMAEQDDRGGISGYEADTYGATIGYDTATGPDSRLGLAFGYAVTDVDGKSLAANATQINSYQLTLYGDYTPGNFYFEGYAGYALNDVEIQSSLTFGGLNREYRGDYISNQYSAGFEMGYDVPFSSSTRIVPYAGFQYYLVTGDTIELRNSGGFDQNVELDNVSVGMGSLGLRLETEFGMGGGAVLEPSIHGAYLYDFFGDEVEASSTYTNGGAAYSVEGAEVEQSAFNVGGAMTFRTASGLMEWSVSYDAEFKDDYASHTGVVNATFKF